MAENGMCSMDETVNKLRGTFKSQKTRPYEWRKAQLQAVLRMIRENEEEFKASAATEMSKPLLEVKMTEISTVEKSVKHALTNLKSWMKPSPVRTEIIHFPTTARIINEPLGVVLVFGAWNFPLNLCLVPLVNALAAGNCVVVKPSELAPKASATLKKVLDKYLDPEAFAVIEGGADVAEELLKRKFDHIFFTGSERVGRIVYEAAAKQLTPVTLELGGKSPAFVDESANFETTARRLLFGKHINSGQICIAADYALVTKGAMQPLRAALLDAYHQFYPKGEASKNETTHLVHQRHTDRLLAMLNEDEKVRGDIVIGGQYDRDCNWIAPTVFYNTKPEARIMQEEIFGPLLPVLPVEDLDDALQFISDRPHPLAAYIFSTNRKTVETFSSRVSTGAVVVNHVILHYSIETLPFGGVGSSGIGRYHGKSGFETFSNRKAFLHKSAASVLDLDIIYPPVTERKVKMLDLLL
uniref:Aldehyde dehydrogenase n=1 Tax=Rhodosorus marinus TaxID=101924 RepID=A0A7S2ZJZ1_9RHOD|mmetsp:Transcript_22216/g.89786  ORF Transcript_22216/g.89786 Transcript_22216/m.89786 type:complete len:469 (+) Transcript_22216:149-1555(+)|eukprot:CAMPEP_0113964432 /NCGR_PEP_ID=MMETSP0011_2-20120614/7136_1 /TAXON_ID=101924 /ORGANISM="Rhodosorus marinus" /LENGTH=468 /DNA_ID=CAMNT_0000976733 /DNA_START=91 /DNA_END=1497 /DNA_ORIENTATION=+ /assembly_acc=CAM_ASM_000156